MRSKNIFWGVVLILLGSLLLLDELGVLPANVWTVFWPILLILLGLWIVRDYFFGKSHRLLEETIAIPLDSAQEVEIDVNHGAGNLMVESGAEPGSLLSGAFEGGVKYTSRHEGGKLWVQLEAQGKGISTVIVPWFGSGSGAFRWDLRLVEGVPMSLNVKTGASEVHLNLTDLHITDLKVETGASSVDILLPNEVTVTRVEIKAGASSLKVRVPDNVAARIQVKGGLMAAQVDNDRFPKRNGVYQSPNYETAPCRVDINADLGVGTIKIE